MLAVPSIADFLVISESTRARKLKLKKQLDIVKYSIWVLNCFR